MVIKYLLVVFQLLEGLMQLFSQAKQGTETNPVYIGEQDLHTYIIKMYAKQ